jgi:hypothetical protein
MPSKRAKKTVTTIPIYLTSAQVARMLDIDSSVIRERFRKGQYPGADKPGGGRTSVIIIPTSLFPEEQVLTFLKKERDQSPD